MELTKINVSNTFDEGRVITNQNFEIVSNTFTKYENLFDFSTKSFSGFETITLSTSNTNIIPIVLDAKQSAITSEKAFFHTIVGKTMNLTLNSNDYALVVNGKSKFTSNVDVEGDLNITKNFRLNNYNTIVINGLTAINYSNDILTLDLSDKLNIILSCEKYVAGSTGPTGCNLIKLTEPKYAGQVVNIIFKNNIQANEFFILNDNNVIIDIDNFEKLTTNKENANLQLQAVGNKWLLMNMNGFTKN